MTVKVTFLKRNEILGAIVRAIAVQVADFQMVGGNNRSYLNRHGFYRFEFANSGQVIQFKSLIQSYVPTNLQSGLQIELEDESN